MPNDEAMTLLRLPLEVRHTIFEHAAARDVRPKKLLRNWFEKKEVKELIAQQTAANPDGPAPRVVHARDYDDESDLGEPQEADGQENEDEDSDEDDENEDDDDDDSEGEGEEQEEDEMDDAQDEQDEAEEDEDVNEGASLATVDPAANAHGQVQSTAEDDERSDDGVERDEVTEASHIDSGAAETEVVDGDVEMTEDETAQQDDTESANDADEDTTMDEDGQEDANQDEDDGEAEQIAPPQPPPIVQAAPKWRHIPNFLRITQCPPPTSLFLVSKQLRDEAKAWFYDVAVLRSEATGSFAHTSFFEEAFSQITDAAFSPMENIRKVEVTFVWDTTWIRSDTTGCVEAIFPALLRQRADFVYQILSRAPDISEVTVHWHDSAQDDESANFMLDILAPFHTLPAPVNIVEHYIATDAKPHKRSIAGKRRVEFQNIADAGLDRLF